MGTVKDYYERFDEWGRLDREPLEFYINMHYLLRYLPEGGHVADIGSGPGKYAIELAKRGYRVGLADMMPRFAEQARENAKAAGVEDRFSGFHASNAMELDCFADMTFDAAVMMGPLYHLQEQGERRGAIRELRRITKPGGTAAVAFMPRSAFLQQCIKNPLQWRPNDRIDALVEFAKTGVFNHSDAGRFTGMYGERVERIIPFMEEEGFETLKLIGSDGYGAALHGQSYEYWSGQGEESYRQLMELISELSDDPSMLGSSTHILYIGRRK